MEIKKLKRVVIKEELVTLTGDFRSAILLNQLIYWSERIKDYDKFIKEERERMLKFSSDPEIFSTAGAVAETLTHGWIYKSAEELSEECMIGLSNATIGRYLKVLIENNWIDERKNPKYKWDRTKQYRVNIMKIQQDLNKLGYALEGYSLEAPISCNFQNENSRSHFEKSQFQNEKSQFQNEKAIPKTTTEITPRDYNKKNREGEPSSTGLSEIEESIENDGLDAVPAIIPSECKNELDKYFIGRFKKERSFYNCDFNNGLYYNAFADALVKAQLQDSVEILTMKQYPYFTSTLKKMIKPLEMERKLLGW